MCSFNSFSLFFSFFYVFLRITVFFATNGIWGKQQLVFSKGSKIHKKVRFFEEEKTIDKNVVFCCCSSLNECIGSVLLLEEVKTYWSWVSAAIRDISDEEAPHLTLLRKTRMKTFDWEQEYPHDFAPITMIGGLFRGRVFFFPFFTKPRGCAQKQIRSETEQPQKNWMERHICERWFSDGNRTNNKL